MMLEQGLTILLVSFTDSMKITINKVIHVKHYQIILGLPNGFELPA